VSKKKIADSIIIRVGGGIREIPRESVEPADKPESTHLEPGFEQKEEVPRKKKCLSLELSWIQIQKLLQIKL
jgi:hypothetical protein